MNRTVDLSPIKLTKEQQDVIDFVDLGHNACMYIWKGRRWKDHSG